MIGWDKWREYNVERAKGLSDHGEYYHLIERATETRKIRDTLDSLLTKIF
jgi:hypothetical protein